MCFHSSFNFHLFGVCVVKVRLSIAQKHSCVMNYAILTMIIVLNTRAQVWVSIVDFFKRFYTII